MYERHYGLRERPFLLQPDPAFLFPSEQHRLALAMLEYGLTTHADFCVLSGAIGTGKTTLIRQLLTQIDDRVTVGLISNTHRAFGPLLPWVLQAYELEGSGKDAVAMHRTLVEFMISQYARNRRALLIIDEAQNLGVDRLEELRLLSNINADKNQILQIFLVGQPELKTLLQRPDLEQFAQRIAVDYHIEPFDPAETVDYIRHRLAVAGGDRALFDDEACALVHRHSQGTPRLINSLCDTALVFGYATRALRINGALIEEAARTKRSGGIFPGTRTCNPDSLSVGSEKKVLSPSAPENPGRLS
ncbi:MAG: AAA family ATPase [Nevskiales bacterium]|nr:AAA family ATPase [Nevskiales bacterium]